MRGSPVAAASPGPGVAGVPTLWAHADAWDPGPEHAFTLGVKFGLVLHLVAGVGVGILSALILFMTFLHPIILLSNIVCRSL